MNQPVHATVQMATVEMTVHVRSQYALFCCTSLHLVRYAVNYINISNVFEADTPLVGMSFAVHICCTIW